MKRVFWMVWLFSVFPVFGVEGDSNLLRAHQAYDGGRYAEAIELYQKELSDGVRDGHVLYNLGNAYYRSAKFGEAIAAYLSAQRLLPRDPDIKANLGYTLKQSGTALAHQQTSWVKALLFWESWVTERELFLGGSWCWTLAFLLLTLTYLNPKRLSWTRRPAYGLLTISLTMFLGCALSHMTTEAWGATIMVTSAKSAPGEHNTTVFELPIGTPVQRMGQQEAWVQVETPDHRRGWVEQNKVLYF